MTNTGVVTVTGASSQLGVFLLPHLQEAGFTVRAISRSAPLEPVEVRDRVSWLRPGLEPELEAASPAAYLVSCGPLDLARKLLASKASLQKAVVFSTSSILTKPDSADQAERKLVTGLASEEGEIRSICRERGITLVLVRPTMIYGCGLDRNVSTLYRLGERTGFIPLSSRADGLRQPVHAEDLARLAVKALTTDLSGDLEGEACGGETLTFREVVKRVAACGSHRIRLLPLPEPLLTAMVWTVLAVRPGKNMNAEMVRRQAKDMVFDDTVFRQSLAYQPRPFNPTRADFNIPPNLEPFRLKL